MNLDNERPLIVGDASHDDVRTFTSDASLRDVARALHKTTAPAVVVVVTEPVDQAPLGVVTCRDVVRAVADEAAPEECTASDVAAPITTFARAEDDLVDTLAQMAELGVTAVPVLDDEGELSGVLSAGEWLHAVAE